jgi:lysophospholipase L1-like esterase
MGLRTLSPGLLRTDDRRAHIVEEFQLVREHELTHSMNFVLKLPTLLFFALTASPILAQETRNYAITPVLHPGTEEQIESFNVISKQGEAELVFLGDSITHGWHGDGQAMWQKYWVPLKAANFGVPGDRTEHVLWRLEHGNFDGLKPKVIVLMIGSNNTGQQGQSQAELGGAIYQCSAQQTARGVTAIVNKLKAKCPEAKILLLAIFPRGEKWDDKYRRQNELTNSLIKEIADGKSIFFMDINAQFLTPRGVLQKDIMPDLLHPNAKGYKIWAEAIYPSVTYLLK